MPFRVHHQTSYYSQSAHNDIAARTQGEWDAYKYCGAVKSGEINGYCTFPPNTRINRNNVADARVKFGEYLAELLRGKGDVFVVPVPSKDSYEAAEFRTLAMVRQALPKLQNRLLPIVRFSKQLERASVGGARGYDAVYPHLQVQRTPGYRKVIIVDDILTSGGTALATRKLLMDAGHQVLFAAVCGRTTWSKLNPFLAGWEDAPDGAKSLDLLA